MSAGATPWATSKTTPQGRGLGEPRHEHRCTRCGWRTTHADALRVRFRVLGRDPGRRAAYRDLHRCACGHLTTEIAVRHLGEAAGLSSAAVAAAAGRLLVEGLRAVAVALLLLPRLLLGGRARFDALSVTWYVRAGYDARFRPMDLLGGDA